MEEIVISELTRLLDEYYTFTLVSKIRQRVCNDPFGKYLFIEKGERVGLSSYSRNSDGSLCFQVDFDKASAYYYPESSNSYDYPVYLPEDGAPENFEDLFHIEGKEKRWRVSR